MADRDIEMRLNEIQETIPVADIILDCSCINNIDSQGVNALIQVCIFFLSIKHIVD